MWYSAGMVPLPPGTVVLQVLPSLETGGVERGTVDDVFTDAGHPYTEGLMNSVPQVEAKGGRLQPIVGQPPNLGLGLRDQAQSCRDGMGQA